MVSGKQQVNTSLLGVPVEAEVVFGVLNVLVGVFLESANEFRDRDLTVQAEVDRLDSFLGVAHPN